VNRGRLLALEGLDGSGKSTQAAALAEVLRAEGHDPLLTREPTEGPYGRRIRSMARSGQAVAPEEELRWFVADRRAHVAEVIQPGLAAGRLVITDRYYLSTVAYQGARGLDPGELLSQSEAEFPLPDLVLLLEIDPELGLQRVSQRGGVAETVFERRQFLEQVEANFRALDLPYLVRIDARGPEQVVHRAVIDCVRQRLGLLEKSP
jgi:dTMP kinase